MSINKNIETAILSIRLYSCLLVWFPSGILRVGFRISRVIGLGLGSCLDCGLSSISAQSRFVSAAGQRSPPGSSESPPCLYIQVHVWDFSIGQTVYLCISLYVFVGRSKVPSEHTIVPSPDIWKIQSVQALNERPYENDDCLGLKEMTHLLPPCQPEKIVNQLSEICQNIPSVWRRGVKSLDFELSESSNCPAPRDIIDHRPV